jgi:hypothetical protein
LASFAAGLALEVTPIHGFAAESDPPEAPPIASVNLGFYAASNPDFVVPRRAPRAPIAGTGESRTIVRTVHADGPPQQSSFWVQAPDFKDASPLTGRGSFTGAGANSLSVAGIGLGTGPAPITHAAKRDLDRRCENAQRVCSNDRNATSGGASLAELSPLGWLVGALNVGIGTYLLITSDRRTGSATSIGADFYKGGGGLKIRRQW